MALIDELLTKEPYNSADRKDFLVAIKEAVLYHYKNSEQYKKFLDNIKFDPNSDFEIEDLPYLPVGLFKELDLLTGKKEDIKKIIHSSSTSGNKPSTVLLDQTTIDRQRKALTKIMADSIGERQPFVVFDCKKTIKSIDNNVSSRGSAIRGLLPFAKEFHFVLDEDLQLDKSALAETIEKISKYDSVVLFGFTWVMYLVMKENSELFAKLPKDKILLHIGGWKKLKDLAVSKDDFNDKASKIFGMSKSNVIDMYGMTEQLGTVYSDCKEGYKHVSAYSDIVMRNLSNLSVCQVGEPGLMQFVSPVPNSYPGISILSDDVGEIMGLDNCKCGRKGKYFVFRKRHEAAEVKGCGDTI